MYLARTLTGEATVSHLETLRLRTPGVQPTNMMLWRQKISGRYRFPSPLMSEADLILFKKLPDANSPAIKDRHY
jgi:hypothetical protein